MAENKDPATDTSATAPPMGLGADGDKVVGLMDTLWGAATGPDGVFGDPITAGDRVVITAREIGLGGGFGWGGGTDGGAAAGGSARKPADDAEATEAGHERRGAGFGHGAGGGGGGSGRPVAIITIGPDGVEVTPILDRTKVGLAAIAAWSAVAIAFFNVVRTLWGAKR
jgi:uncharacterized spore protein YtfJ